MKILTRGKSVVGGRGGKEGEHLCTVPLEGEKEEGEREEGERKRGG